MNIINKLYRLVRNIPYLPMSPIYEEMVKDRISIIVKPVIKKYANIAIGKDDLICPACEAMGEDSYACWCSMCQQIAVRNKVRKEQRIKLKEILKVIK